MTALYAFALLGVVTFSVGVGVLIAWLLSTIVRPTHQPRAWPDMPPIARALPDRRLEIPEMRRRQLIPIGEVTVVPAGLRDFGDDEVR